MHQKPTPPVKSRGKGKKFCYKVDNPQFKVIKTDNGITREFKHANGEVYREFHSHGTLFGMPMISIVRGTSPETGKMGIANGFIAIGQRAVGVIAIGQFVNGYISLGQFATGRVAALGQFAAAPLAIGQLTIGAVAAGQLVVAALGAGQIGLVGFGAFQIAATLFGGVGQHITQVFM